jgi:hypothetical protein
VGGLVRPESGNTASRQLQAARGLIALALMKAEADLVRRAVEQLEPQGNEQRLAENVLEMLAEPTLSAERLAAVMVMAK